MIRPNVSSSAAAFLPQPKGLTYGSVLLALLLAAPPALAQPAAEPGEAPSAEPEAPPAMPSMPTDSSGGAAQPSAAGSGIPQEPSGPTLGGSAPGAGAASPAAAEPRAAISPSSAESCGPTAVRTIHGSLASALARVEAPGTRGLGIAIDGSGHVLTALSIVEVGRGVKVRFWQEESWRDATVVAVDEEHDLAIVQVEGVAPAAFGRIADRGAEIGDSVVALTLSTSFDGYDLQQDLVLQPGSVTAQESGRLRSNALDRDHHRIGAPLVDCSGAVVGVATERHGDESATTEAVRALVAGMTMQEPYDGNWSFAHPAISFGAQFGHRWAEGFDAPDRWFGVRMGTALIGLDQWYFPVRIGLYGLAGPDPDSELAERSGIRFQAETGIGYRAMLKGGAMPVYLIPQATAVLSWERTRLEGNDFSLDLANCLPGATCPVTVTPTTVEDELFRVMPAAGLVLGLGRGELGYQFQIDVEEIDRSVHSVTAGFQF